jgi:hypothetical protein
MELIAKDPRTSGMREEWVCSSWQREYYFTIRCNSEGIGEDVPRYPEVRYIPSTGCQYSVSSKIVEASISVNKCEFFLTKLVASGATFDWYYVSFKAYIKTSGKWCPQVGQDNSFHGTNSPL